MKTQTIEIRDTQGVYHSVERDHLIDKAKDAARQHFERKPFQIHNRQHAENLLELQLADREQEIFVLVTLDGHHRVIAIHEMHKGTVNQAAVYPREIVKQSLADNAAAVVFAHNHPSGVSEPSDADTSITRQLRDALATVGVRVLDHLVVGDRVTSLHDRGLM